MSFYTQDDNDDAVYGDFGGFGFGGDDNGTSAGGAPNDAGAALTCGACGGSDFYTSSETGMLHCSSCFAQSQSSTVREELEYGEVQAMIGRSGRSGATVAGGPRVSMGYSLRRGGRDWASGRPKYVTVADLQSLDRSRPLPTLRECLGGYQSLLRRAAEKAAALAGVDPPDELVGCVRAVWFAYLRAWGEAAEAYGARYPDVRFSLRDAFLEKPMKRYIVEKLAEDARKRLRTSSSAGGGATTKGKGKGRKKRRRLERERDGDRDRDEESDNGGSGSGSDSGDSGDSGDLLAAGDNGSDHKSVDARARSDDERDININVDMEGVGLGLCGLSLALGKKQSSFNPANKVHRNKSYHHLMQILAWKNRDSPTDEPPHPMEAALRCQPSMPFILCILHVALRRLRAGVASSHLLKWAACGAVPCVRGFSELPKRHRDDLVALRTFFRCIALPRPSEIERQSELLAIAISSRDIAPGPMTSAGGVGGVGNNDEGGGGVDDDRGAPESRCNVPLLAARFVQEAGLGQVVLDYALSLMGVSRERRRNPGSSHHDEAMNRGGGGDGDGDHRGATGRRWLPPQLPSAAADRIHSRVEVMAVVGVACRMCRGWETWAYRSSNAWVATGGGGTGGRGAISGTHGNLNRVNDDEDRLLGTNRGTVTSGDCWCVPWSDAQLDMLANGRSLDGYLDFIDRVLYHQEPYRKELEGFIEWLEEERRNNPSPPRRTSSELDDARSPGSPNREYVLPNDILAGAPNPNTPPPVKQVLDTVPTDKNSHRHRLVEDNNASNDDEGKRRSRREDWEEANGIGSFVTYHNRDGHAADVFRNARRQYHPHYGLLVEYLSHKVCVEPSDLHKHITILDEELVAVLGEGVGS